MIDYKSCISAFKSEVFLMEVPISGFYLNLNMDVLSIKHQAHNRQPDNRQLQRAKKR